MCRFEVPGTRGAGTGGPSRAHPAELPTVSNRSLAAAEVWRIRESWPARVRPCTVMGIRCGRHYPLSRQEVTMAKTLSGIEVRAETLRVFRGGGDADDVREVLAVDHVKARRVREPYLDPLLDLAVEVYALTGASRDRPIAMEQFVETYLAGYEFRGKVDTRKLHYALTYPALVHGGLEPDLGSDLYYWNSELWPYALYAIEAYLRVAAERTGHSVADLTRDLPD
jgi:hypothetical protein